MPYPQTGTLAPGLHVVQSFNVSLTTNNQLNQVTIMPNRRNSPKDLTSLIEKRETDDRRQEERRTGQAEVEIVGDEQRTGDDRRQNEDRRARRGGD